jgi:iron(III) transport system ATP-binding protein
MASESLIVLESVVKRFPGAFVLGPITLDVKKGELVAVLGPSGCGKTTLLRLIAGFERPDEGSIVIDGRIVAGRSQWVEPEDRQVGMVFQDYALFPHLTVAQNVSFGMKFRPNPLSPFPKREGGTPLPHPFPLRLRRGSGEVRGVGGEVWCASSCS